MNRLLRTLRLATFALTAGAVAIAVARALQGGQRPRPVAQEPLAAPPKTTPSPQPVPTSTAEADSGSPPEARDVAAATGPAAVGEGQPPEPTPEGTTRAESGSPWTEVLTSVEADEETSEPLPRDSALEATLNDAIASMPRYGGTSPGRSAASYLDEGNVYFSVGQYGMAIDRYTRALELEPDNAAALYNRANARARTRAYDEALEDYNRALELSPNDPDILNNRGMLHLIRHRFAEAIADFERALALDPQDTTVLVNRGLAYLQASESERALADFRTALELDPRDADARYGAASALAVLRRTDEALAELREALALDPSLAREATSDPRLAPLRDNPEFIRLLRGAQRA